MKYWTLTIATLLGLTVHATTPAAPIDFNSLNIDDVMDLDGQDFAWRLGDESGVVNVRADWSNVLQVNGSLRTATAPPANLAAPFHGTVQLTFDQPVQLRLHATFASLTRDGLDGGRYEQVRLSATGNVTFVGASNTSAIYSGEGSSSILVDDQFTPTPVLSDWGILGQGVADSYILEYTSTRVGLSETFDVFVVPEPNGGWCLGLTLVVALVRRRRHHSCARAGS